MSNGLAVLIYSTTNTTLYPCAESRRAWGSESAGWVNPGVVLRLSGWAGPPGLIGVGLAPCSRLNSHGGFARVFSKKKGLDEQVQRNSNELGQESYDLLVIGGGIFGACAAWDATLRGLKVALIEQTDFGSGTSANSFKMVHGGIRYLQHADIVRLRASCHERSAMLRIAPHLVQPLPIMIPTYGLGKSGKFFLGAGMYLYDLLTLGRNRGIRDPKRHITWTRFFNRAQVLKQFPDLAAEGLTGAAQFYDGQMYNPTRLVLAFIKSAQAKGAHAANYMRATSLLREKNRVVGVLAVDEQSGHTVPIKARLVLNAAGPWSEWLLEADAARHAMQARATPVKKGTYSRDACFVIKRRFSGPMALAVQGRTKDPDALLSRPARHLFLVPWRQYTLVGVWHVVWPGHPATVNVTKAEIQTFIDEINWAYPSLELSTADVLLWNAGLVPFGENEQGAENLSYGKRSNMIDHSISESLDGLVTLIGIRYTTARGDAAKAVDLICRKLGRQVTAADTANTVLIGGDIADFETLVADYHRQQPFGISEPCIRALTHNYGTQAPRVLAYVNADPRLAATLGDSLVLQAEVVHAVKEELAYRLSDVVFRRTDLATGGDPGAAALQQCAALMAKLLGWDEKTQQQELAAVQQRFPTFQCKSAIG